MGCVFLVHKKADEPGRQRFCIAEPAAVSSQRAGAAAGELVLEVFLEMALNEIWHSFEV